MASTLVIKVKYGDTLRRFNACVNEKNQLDIDVAGLRAKILSLFKFPADTNFMLRYVDEDGDLVTLADDDDLHDVMKQQLKFLRLDVHISNANGGKCNNAASNGNAIPLTSPPVKNPYISGTIAAVTDVLKSLPLPEPLHEFLSNLSIPLASKTASSGPVPSTHADNTSAIDLNLPCDSSPSQFTNVNAAPVSPAVPGGDGKEEKMDTIVKGDNDTCSVSTSYAAPDYSSMLTNAVDSSHTAFDVMFHEDVYCDGCGVHIIDGPWFRSKVFHRKRENDLCSICFYRFGKQADYIRMDLPVCDQSPQSFNDAYEYPPCTCSRSPTLPQFFQAGSIWNGMRPRLDSQFTFDVNVVDGTMMAPSTEFTKIWRMRNNGTIVWPKGIQLVWIGGDKFSDFDSVTLEIPAYGVPVDKEFDIAVDFRAPPLRGKYISYWRMASPTGKRFGQRVWVSIQVDGSLKDSFYDSSQGLNSNISLDGSASKVPGVIDINVQPIVDDASPQSCNCNASTQPENQLVDKHPRQELENKFPMYETPFIGHVSDFSELLNPKMSAVDVPSSSLVDKIGLLGVAALEELQEMGYEYNLEQSLDELYDVSVWDPIIGRVRRIGN